jgi:RNA polymerase sigma factor (sigma-70 family)
VSEGDEADRYVSNTDRTAPGVTSPDDTALVQRALAGDVGAFGELVRRHQSAALRLAAGICGSTEEARDIVQDAFVKGHRGLRSWRGDAPVRSWLLRIVANDARNAVRARARRHRREERFGALRQVGDGDPVGDAVAGDDEARALLALLGRLDERDRAVLACRFVGGLSERETAEALDLPTGTVKSRTARALERARALVDEVPS